MNTLRLTYFFLLFSFNISVDIQAQSRSTIDFNKGWKFLLGDDSAAGQPAYDDSKWRQLSLPHDWSIERDFSKDHPATTQGGQSGAGLKE